MFPWAYTIVLSICAALLWQTAAQAGVIDNTSAEAAFQAGDYPAAQAEFEAAIAQFKAAPKDNTDRKSYREALYLYDRLADCCFTQRDWSALKRHNDMLWKLVNAEQSLCNSQLAGAFDSGVAVATARFIADQLDESMRLKSIFQVKRSLALLLHESQGKGDSGAKYIRLYQELVLALRHVISEEDGAYELDVRALNENIGLFEKIYAQLPDEKQLASLWERHRPDVVPVIEPTKDEPAR